MTINEKNNADILIIKFNSDKNIDAGVSIFEIVAHFGYPDEKLKIFEPQTFTEFVETVSTESTDRITFFGHGSPTGVMIGDVETPWPVMYDFIISFPEKTFYGAASYSDIPFQTNIPHFAGWHGKIDARAAAIMAATTMAPLDQREWSSELMSYCDRYLRELTFPLVEMNHQEITKGQDPNYEQPSLIQNGFFHREIVRQIMEDPKYPEWAKEMEEQANNPLKYARSIGCDHCQKWIRKEKYANHMLEHHNIKVPKAFIFTEEE